MRRELTYCVLGLALLTAAVFAVLLDNYHARGLEGASKGALLMEVRAFDIRYRENPDVELPNSYIMHFYLDSWAEAPDFYRQLIAFDDLEQGGFLNVSWKPNDQDAWQDSRFLVAYRHQLADGRDLYAVLDYDANLLTSGEQSAADRASNRVFYIGGIYLLLMLCAVWFYNNRVNRFTNNLAHWAEQLSLEQIDQPRPDFRYTELNRIAEQLQQAFQRIASVLAREHQFLRHASHELRTPIAVIRANIELIERLGLPASMQSPFSRVQRANQNMLQLTETLLWMSRENTTSPSLSLVCIDQMMDELSEELSYLLQDKAVEVSRQYLTDMPGMQLPATPLRIVLSNLIRNAYQYTDEGQVSFYVAEDRVIIENRFQGEGNVESDASFGLGLMLVQQICDRLAWQLELQPLDYGMRAVLTLPLSDIDAIRTV